MQISREQYNRFLNNQCSEEERLLFTRYLEQNPDQVEQWMQPEDWEKFQSDMHLHPAFSQRMRERFLQFIESSKRKRLRLYKISMAAAISGLIIFSVAWLTLNRKVEKPIIVRKTEASPAKESWRVISNQSDTTSVITLKDQSVVKLYAHSVLRFPETPKKNRRDIFLEGTAYFTVTKDSARPFTVYASNIATTALGTAFTVQADIAGKNVQVKLHEGKVVVHKVDSTGNGAQKDYYLLPGDRLVVNATGKISLQHFVKKQKKVSVKKNISHSRAALSFNNTPLVDVLKQLSATFNAEIHCNAEELKAIYITASFTERDTLPGILEIICALNNLRLQNADGAFAIGR